MQVRNKIIKIFSILFSVFFVIIAINTIFFNKTVFINFSTSIMLTLTILSYIIVFLMYKLLRKRNKLFEIKAQYKILIAVIIFLVQLVIAGLTYANCGWDCGGVIDSSFSLFIGEGINFEYFARYPNNIALMLLYKYVYVIVRII